MWYNQSKLVHYKLNKNNDISYYMLILIRNCKLFLIRFYHLNNFYKKNYLLQHTNKHINHGIVKH